MLAYVAYMKVYFQYRQIQLTSNIGCFSKNSNAFIDLLILIYVETTIITSSKRGIGSGINMFNIISENCIYHGQQTYISKKIIIATIIETPLFYLIFKVYSYLLNIKYVLIISVLSRWTDFQFFNNC